ncbi:MAG: hypothetical protein K9G67_09615 [Bacteroidales bacterium]|nr:hypothetical protein [Bacteroidales bacterium]MCF8350552.1 hypothetical protein [Bacteroidales bacterium]MCF8376599.1 hypothetical protein [Bacteroidales bacterium]MCF8401184.1 hypothetical protein [Bacteroidales bacterium]
MNYRLIFVLLLSAALLPLKQVSAQNTIDEAVELIKKIKHADPFQQDRLRAEKAFQIVTDRVEVLNDFSGSFLQTLPVDFWNYFQEEGNIKTRAEVMAFARDKGWNMGEVAWLIKGGQCDEHASLMQILLQRSGVKNVTIVRSNSPHAFPVVNPLPGFDPDNPWTWGKNAFVPDSWAGKVILPLDTWYENHDFPSSIYFKEGEYYADMGSMTNRERLKKYLNRGSTFIREHCDTYKPILNNYLKYPAEVRAKLGLNPPEDICKGRPMNRLVLYETSFEMYDGDTRTFVTGTERATPTSVRFIDKGSFFFKSDMDGFQLEIYWDQPPELWNAFESIPLQISAITRGGPRPVSVFFTPVWDMTIWDVRMPVENENANRTGVNSYVLKFPLLEELPENDLFRSLSMELSVVPVGKKASVKDGFVEGGGGKFYLGEKPGEFDAYYLQLNCTGLAKITWTYVPEGSPHLKNK